jgi:hypothetical protein
MDALTRIARASEAIGIAVVMLDVFDCGDPERVERRKAMYQGFGSGSCRAGSDRRTCVG